MSGDHAHLLPAAPGMNFAGLGLVLKTRMRADGLAMRDVAAATGIAANVVGLAACGRKVDARSVLALCLWLNLNPFALLEAA